MATYQDSKGKTFSSRSQAKASNEKIRSSGAGGIKDARVRKSKSIDYTFDSRKESASQYNERIARERGDSASELKSMQSATKTAFDKKGLDINKINTGSLTQSAPWMAPVAPVAQDPGKIVNAGNAGLVTGMDEYQLDQNGLFQKIDNGTLTQADTLRFIQENTPQMPNVEKAYLKSKEYRTVNEAQKQVNDYTAQLNQITAQSNAQQLALEGQGRGQTTGFIGGEQARINREAAIAALPIQAQLAAAQGNLEFAQKQLDTVFTLRMQDAQNKYKYETDKLNSIVSFLDKAETRQYNEKMMLNEREYNKTQNNINYLRQLTAQAREYGNTSVIGQLGAIDPSSPTFEQDVARVAQGIVNPSSDVITTGDGRYDGIINTILASGKFTKDQANAVRRAIASGEDPVTVIKNNAKMIMGTSESDKVSNLEVAKSTLASIDAQLKEFYAKGGKTGIFSGNYEKVVNKLGEVDNPELVELATQIQGNLQIYRNAVSGTAYSVQEGVDIASIFPGINKSQGLNTAIINGRLRDFDSTIDARYRSVLGSAYDSIKGVENTIEEQQQTQTFSEETQDIEFSQPTGFFGGIKKFFSGLF